MLITPLDHPWRTELWVAGHIYFDAIHKLKVLAHDFSCQKLGINSQLLAHEVCHGEALKMTASFSMIDFLIGLCLSVLGDPDFWRNYVIMLLMVLKSGYLTQQNWGPIKLVLRLHTLCMGHVELKLSKTRTTGSKGSCTHANQTLRNRTVKSRTLDWL